MFRFDSPIYLWLLLLIPLSVIIYLYSVRKRKLRMAKFGNPTLIHQLSPMTSQKRGWIKFVLVELVLLLLILIIARPQVGSKIATNKEREGVETIIALDISNSMLAEDVAPSRLEKSKLLVENLMNKFSEDKIGFIKFSTSNLLFSKREGATSSASIELLISSAIMVSMPSRSLFVAILLPT